VAKAPEVTARGCRLDRKRPPICADYASPDSDERHHDFRALGRRRVPEVSGRCAIGGVEEGLALVVVLADEQNRRPRAAARADRDLLRGDGPRVADERALRPRVAGPARAFSGSPDPLTPSCRRQAVSLARCQLRLPPRSRHARGRPPRARGGAVGRAAVSPPITSDDDDLPARTHGGSFRVRGDHHGALGCGWTVGSGRVAPGTSVVA
jgi:hypothetical protein